MISHSLTRPALRMQIATQINAETVLSPPVIVPVHLKLMAGLVRSTLRVDMGYLPDKT
jgi:hypothetical protein